MSTYPYEPIMTDEEYQTLKERLPRMREESHQMAYMMFCKGANQVDAARHFGKKKQQAQWVYSRYVEARNEVPKGWRKVEVFLPPDKAKQVEEMEKREREKFQNKAQQ